MDGHTERSEKITFFAPQNHKSTKAEYSEGPKRRVSGAPIQNWRTTVSQSVGTCFVGIPSDRILFPSERGDKTSFFQYMNSWRLAAYSVSRVGAWNRERMTRAMGRQDARIIRTMRGFRCESARCYFHALSLPLQQNAAGPPPTQKLGGAVCCSARKPYLEQKDFFLSPFLPPLSFPLFGRGSMTTGSGSNRALGSFFTPGAPEVEGDCRAATSRSVCAELQ